MLTNRLNAYLPLAGGLDRVLDELWRSFPGATSPLDLGRREGAFPAVNVWETESGLTAELEVPGLAMEDLDLEVEGDVLSIRGEFKEPTDEGTKVHCRERSSGSFSRRLRLPVEVDADKVEARLERGVLTIDLPKAAAALPRKIRVTRVQD